MKIAYVICVGTGVVGVALQQLAWRHDGLKRCQYVGNICDAKTWTPLGVGVVVLASVLLLASVTILFALINRRIFHAMLDTSQ
jgi:hypothetical protein